MRDLDTLKFDIMPDLVRGIHYDTGRAPTAGYISETDTIYLTTDNIADITHELCERDMIDLIGEWCGGRDGCEAPYVCNYRDRNHVMSLGTKRGGWRLWGMRQ